MDNQARLVIIGAGVVGVSAAYHLAKLGWRDVIVLDQNDLFETGGSSSHAPGLIFQTNPSKMMTGFAKYTVDLFSALTTGEKPVFYPVGSIEVAYTPERLAELKRRWGFAAAYGLEAHLIPPGEARNLIPLIDQNKIYGGYYVPSDGDAKAVNAVEAMADSASGSGAVTFVGGVPVTDIEFETKRGRVTAVLTPRGRIETETVLLCTNIWAPVLGDKVGLTIPLMAVEHLYTITTPLPELAGEKREIVHPILRHQDHAMYFRQHADAYGIGSYQHQPLLVDPRELGKTAMRDFTPSHFEAAWKSTCELMPSIKSAQLATKFNGMFAFTIDGMPILGEAPHLKGFWTAVGVWVTHSGGVGRAIAEWMTGGVPGTDLREADLNRFHAHAKTKPYVRARCYTQYDEVYDIIHPAQQMENPRNLRLTPFHARFQDLGAVFFESAGWERPQWFEANKALLDTYNVPDRRGWAAQNWSPIQGAEHLATREAAALFDLTAFTKIEIKGPGALAFLNYLAANQIDRPMGKVVYTALLNQKGGIKADLTITRLAGDKFLLLTGGGTGPLDLAWLQAHVPPDGSVDIIDLSAKYCGLGLWGPKARQILQGLSQDDVSNEAFPYFSAKSITIDTIPAFALRLSYVGELGWEIYTAPEYGPRLWDVLWEAGQPHGLIVAGGGAFDSLRLEKGYRLWGNDIHTDYNPYEAGLGWAVKPGKGDFVGREALLKIREGGALRALCCLTLDAPDGMALGKEPIFDGERVLGYVTSANTGYTVGKHIAYGYLPIKYAAEGTQVEIAYFGRRYRATVSKEPLFDPKGERLRE